MEGEGQDEGESSPIRTCVSQMLTVHCGVRRLPRLRMLRRTEETTGNEDAWRFRVYATVVDAVPKGCMVQVQSQDACGVGPRTLMLWRAD